MNFDPVDRDEREYAHQMGVEADREASFEELLEYTVDNVIDNPEDYGELVEDVITEYDSGVAVNKDYHLRILRDSTRHEKLELIEYMQKELESILRYECKRMLEKR